MSDHKLLFERHESQVRSYCPCRRFDALFVPASGSALFDSAGRRYVDFLAGCGALNYGHNDPDMAHALVTNIRQQGLVMSMNLHTDVKHRFIELFIRNVLAPQALPYRVQFTGPTGTNAIEAALKLS